MKESYYCRFGHAYKTAEATRRCNNRKTTTRNVLRSKNPKRSAISKKESERRFRLGI